MSARYFVFDAYGNQSHWIPSAVYLILKSATVPPNPHAPQLAELLCQSGERLGNSRAHNSFAHTDGEMLMNPSELHCGHLIFHSSATLTFHLYQSQLCSDEGPKIAPMKCSSATLNFTTTWSEPGVRPMPTPKLYSSPCGSSPSTTGKI